MAEKWPEDERFRRFAARNADSVMFLLNSGMGIGDCYPRYCPLGAVAFKSGNLQLHHPTEHRYGLQFGDEDFADKFIKGFDGELSSRLSPAYRLGQAYRKRFVEQGGARG